MSRIAVLGGVAATGAMLALSGCNIPSAPETKDVMDPHLAGQIPENWRASNSSSHPDNDWVRSFNDAKLNQLVASALTHNPAMAVAEANVEASRAAVRIAGARLYPWVAAKGLVERQGMNLDGAIDRGIDARLQQFAAPRTGSGYREARDARRGHHGRRPFQRTRQTPAPIGAGAE